MVSKSGAVKKTASWTPASLPKIALRQIGIILELHINLVTTNAKKQEKREKPKLLSSFLPLQCSYLNLLSLRVRTILLSRFLLTEEGFFFYVRAESDGGLGLASQVFAKGLLEEVDG